MGVSGAECEETDAKYKVLRRLWAADADPSVHRSCRALLATMPPAKHMPLLGMTETCGESSLSTSRGSQPPFPKSAPSHDNEVLQFTTKTVSSAATNRLVETAIPKNLPAELSATQFGAIHDPLSHAPPSPSSGPWQLAARSRRQSSCFLPCSPGPCALPGHSLSRARVHEQSSAHASKRVDPPFAERNQRRYVGSS